MTILILKRRTGETILVGDDIEITLLDSHGTHARIRVRAPEHIRILRAELKRHPVEPEPATPTPVIGRKRRQLR